MIPCRQNQLISSNMSSITCLDTIPAHGSSLAKYEVDLNALCLSCPRKNVDPTLSAQPDESRPCFASGEETLLPSTYSLLVRHRYNTADKLRLRVPNAPNKKRSPPYASQGDPISQANVSTSLPIAQQGVLCAATFIYRDTMNTTQISVLRCHNSKNIDCVYHPLHRASPHPRLFLLRLVALIHHFSRTSDGNIEADRIDAVDSMMRYGANTFGASVLLATM